MECLIGSNFKSYRGNSVEYWEKLCGVLSQLGTNQLNVFCVITYVSQVCVSFSYRNVIGLPCFLGKFLGSLWFKIADYYMVLITPRISAL